MALAALPMANATHTRPPLNKRMGIAITSYIIRWRSVVQSANYPGFKHAVELLEHCHQIGAGGLQVGVDNWETDFSKKVRDRRESLGLYLEGSIALPKNEADIARFETSVKNAKEAGATILRTVCLSGRRYENFQTADAFMQFTKESYRRLEWAEAIAHKHQIQLALENHKDWRIPEMLKLIKHLDSEWVGVTLDTGNNLALLEDPLEVVRALAPYTISIHFKDMGYKEYEDGFLLSEVPLGEGNLDLQKMIDICEKHNPKVDYSLEMITRDPLKIPCLKEDYWATFDHLPGRDLAFALNAVRSFKSDRELPAIADKNPEQRLAFEEENILKSLSFAKAKLGFG